MTTATELVVAVDLGGTFTKLGLIDRNGEVLAEERVPTKLTADADGDGRGTVDWLGDQIAAMAESGAAEIGGRAVAYGLIVPGIVDATSGVAVAAPNIGWSKIELAAPLSRRVGIPGTIGHDVRTAGLAEWKLGAGRDVANLLFVPLGTGIAAAAVVDGRLLEADGYAGELGHVSVPAAGDRVCACGRVGCLEIVASASGVVRNYVAMTGAAQPPNAEQLANAARSGDRDALAAFEVAAVALAEAFTMALTLLGPETIVIGGGLSGAADLLFDTIEGEFDRRLTFQRRPNLTTSAFGSQAGMIGAGLLGWQQAGDNTPGDPAPVA